MPNIKKPISHNQKEFNQIHQMIIEAHSKSWRSVNTNLIELYWSIGQYVSVKTRDAGWGKNTVEALAEYIKSQNLPKKGFSARNIWRMKQFFETYEEKKELSALLTEISWTNHLHILSKTKTMEEKQYYLNLTSKHHYPERTLARLIDSSTFERTFIADQKLSAVLAEYPVNAKGIFKDSYVFEFLDRKSVV